MGIDGITTNLMECIRNKGRHGRHDPSSERREKGICDKTPGLPTPAPAFNPPDPERASGCRAVVMREN
jgi:hypothetical protein